MFVLDIITSQSSVVWWFTRNGSLNFWHISKAVQSGKCTKCSSRLAFFLLAIPEPETSALHPCAARLVLHSMEVLFGEGGWPWTSASIHPQRTNCAWGAVRAQVCLGARSVFRCLLFCWGLGEASHVVTGFQKSVAFMVWTPRSDCNYIHIDRFWDGVYFKIIVTNIGFARPMIQYFKKCCLHFAQCN